MSCRTLDIYSCRRRFLCCGTFLGYRRYQYTVTTTALTAGVTYYLFVDGNLGDFGDVCIRVAGPPACPPPTTVSSNTVTNNSANVTWVGTGTFVVEYGPSGFTPGTGATAGSGTVINPAVSPQAITGLNPASVYDVYVRQDCTGSANGFSTNVKTSFTTTGAPLNDDAPGAIALTVGAGCTGSPYVNAGATAGATEPYPSCSGTIASPVWFKFVAPASGAVRISTDVTAGTFVDSKVGLFSATDVNDYTTFNIISCDDDGGSVNGSGFLSVVYATGLPAVQLTILL